MAKFCLLALLTILPVPSFAEGPNQNPWPNLVPSEDGEPLPDTEPLIWDGDLAARMLDGTHRFLDQKIATARERRDVVWRDLTPAELAEKRTRFRRIIGLRDTLAENSKFEFYASEPSPSTGHSSTVRWPAFGDVTGAGHLFSPGADPVADIVLLTEPGHDATAQLVQRLLARHIRVLVPATVPRNHDSSGIPTREWLHRPAFELGRTLVGYEVQKILAGVAALRASQKNASPVGIAGTEGDAGRLALFAAAAAPTAFDSVLCGGYFRPLEKTWRGPADHNLFGLLEEFGAAEIAALTSPQALIVHDCPIPEISVPAGGKAKPTVPGDAPTEAVIRAEFDRAAALLGKTSPIFLRTGDAYSAAPFDALTDALGASEPSPSAPAGEIFSHVFPPDLIASQIHELDRHTQSLIAPSRKIRTGFMAGLDFSTPEAFANSQEPYRRIFSEEIIGQFDDALLPPNPRSRPFRSGPTTVSYEVVLDVFPEVFAYGILTLPYGLTPDEKRPVVVCQHGLEGRPQDVVGESKFDAYKAFATRLAERGFITFAPQNLYIGRDDFRLLQFKANSVGATLFSIIIPQHRQIVAWLGSLPNVDPERIGFYGLSYGGKSAMRIPPLVPEYKAVICSADFNEWVWKNTATDSNYSYVDKGEYEIFEWNLGNTFNYAEMAALIAPRPFMVERGHFDGVAPDEMVAFEFAKVRHLYQAKLGIGNHAEIEWFVGPHTINGNGTYDFLHRHLDWPKPVPK